MLLYYLEETCTGVFLLMAAVTACALYAYRVDSRRPDGDPKKKHYHPLAILFAPITFPILAVLIVSLFVLRVTAYGIFMVLFIFALIFIRKPFVLEWLKKTALKTGDLLMTANTTFIRIFLPPLAGSRGSA
jgi:hypothetical protein